MKLVEIWNAKGAWLTFAALKKDPKLAYRLMTYQKKVQAELATCEEIREKLVYQHAGIEPPAVVSLGVDTPQYAAFLIDFSKALQADSDLQWAEVSMDAMVEAIAMFPTNSISENELQQLEPFFTEPPKKEAHLTVVE